MREVRLTDMCILITLVYMNLSLYKEAYFDASAATVDGLVILSTKSHRILEGAGSNLPHHNHHTPVRLQLEWWIKLS